MYEHNLFSQQGWECPKCGSILSPSMMWCPFCSGKKEVTYTTTTTSYDDRKTENSSEKPNNCGEQTEPLQTCSVNGRPYSECSSCEHFRCTADEPQTDCPWK